MGAVFATVKDRAAETVALRFGQELNEDGKWNTSLFHMTLSYAAIFLADTDLKMLFCGD